MSEVPPELLRPQRPGTWRDRLQDLAESFDLTPVRLVAGLTALVVVGLVGWRLLAAPPPPAEMRLPLTSTTSRPASTAPAGDAGGEVVVHVAGAVAAPGVRNLPGDARVADAIAAAGGAVPDADLGRINLAAHVEDGQQVYVPKQGEPAPAAAPGGSTPAGPTAPLNVNTASAEELDALPGVGPAIAQAIVDHRTQNGPFASVENLLDVRGIGQAKLDTLRPQVTV